jgi:hypothetical protein
VVDSRYIFALICEAWIGGGRCVCDFASGRGGDGLRGRVGGRWLTESGPGSSAVECYTFGCE